MSRLAVVSFSLFCVSCLTGCPSLVTITNNGPNPVTITGTPSPVDPNFPLTIPPGEHEVIDWTGGPVTIQAVDMTTFNSDTLTDYVIDRPGAPDLFIEWDGTQLIDHDTMKP